MSAIPLPVQPVDATLGVQAAINNDDGLPNTRPIAFSESRRNQLSRNDIFFRKAVIGSRVYEWTPLVAGRNVAFGPTYHER